MTCSKSAKTRSLKIYLQLQRRSHLRNNHGAVPKTNNYKIFFFVQSIKMLNLSLNELKLITKSRGIKDYKSMSEDRLLSAFNASESVKESEKNFDDTKSTRN